jgi:hypothetical protein
MTGNKDVDQEIDLISKLPYDVCYECKGFYRPDKTGFFSTGDVIGQCRKKSPQINGWPIVCMSDWCGEFEAKG